MLVPSLISLSCLLAVAQVRPGAEAPIPPKIKKFLERCENSRRGAVLQAEERLRRLRRQRPATRQSRAEIAQLEQRLRELESNVRPVVPQLSFPPRAGAIGRLPRLSCHVDQVVSDDELLVRCFFPVVVTTVRNFRARNEKVIQPMRFVIRGQSTKGTDEGTDVEMLGVFEIVGQERYRTQRGGGRNVWVMKPFDLTSIEPYFRQASRSR